MPKKITTTTTQDPFLNGGAYGMPLIEAIMTPSSITHVLLAAVFLCCFPAYIFYYRKNLEHHKRSTLYPFVSHIYRVIVIFYPLCFALGFVFILRFRVLVLSEYSTYTLTVLCIVGIVIFCHIETYYVIIVGLSVHRFWNNKNPEEHRKNLSKRTLIVLMIVVFLVLGVKDHFWIYQFAFALLRINEDSAIDVMPYFIIYCIEQCLLFVAMAMQFLMRNSSHFHSENIMSTQVKKVGAVKFVLAVLCVICYFIEFHVSRVCELFFFIDFFLVPLIIETSEIWSDPNTIAPTEVKKSSSN